VNWVVEVVPWEGVAGTPWEGRCRALASGLSLPGDGLVLLDERCPGVSADDVRRVVAAAAGAVAVGVRPVTDTVKALQDGYVGPTVDRDALVAVCSPVAVPGELLGLVGSRDLPALVAGLLDDGVPVALVELPATARRVADADELALIGP
jgi:hypothetical protein